MHPSWEEHLSRRQHLKTSLSAELGAFWSSTLFNTIAAPSCHWDGHKHSSLLCTQVPWVCWCHPDLLNRGSRSRWDLGSPHCTATHIGNALLQKNRDLPTPQLCHYSGQDWAAWPFPSTATHSAPLQQQPRVATAVVYPKSNYKAVSKYCMFAQTPSSATLLTCLQ